MILSPSLSEKVNILADTSDDVIMLFPPLEQAVIIALKRMKNERDAQ